MKLTFTLYFLIKRCNEIFMIFPFEIEGLSLVLAINNYLSEINCHHHCNLKNIDILITIKNLNPCKSFIVTSPS